jgi:HPt (histidine-containing phosphotransfer) domain-containing protein
MSGDLEGVLAQLREEYLGGITDTLDEIDGFIDRMIRGVGDRGDDFFELQRQIHSLKGSAGTHGFAAVTLVAHRLEDYIEATRRLSNDQLGDVQIYVDRIREIFEAGQDPSAEQLDAIVLGLPSSAAATVDADQVRNVTVLLVMTKGVERTVIGRELASCGFDLSFTELPIEAIGLALSLHPDLIVASTEFKLLSGVELARVLETIEATSEIPFVLTTSHEPGSPVLKSLPDKVRIVPKGQKLLDGLTTCLIDLGMFGKI